jgi:putative heme iron utilization protein
MAIHIKPENKGKLHANLGVPSGQKIPVSRLESAKHSSSAAVRKRATFAMNARHWHHGGGKMFTGFQR